MKNKKSTAELELELSELKNKYSTANISPLAPENGFPILPQIQGIRFAAAAANVKYSERNDVMLIECAAGSSIAGLFTKSSTRSASVLYCQNKLKIGINDKGGFMALFSSHPPIEARIAALEERAIGRS